LLAASHEDVLSVVDLESESTVKFRPGCAAQAAAGFEERDPGARVQTMNRGLQAG
jgi:hypothetical protein